MKKLLMKTQELRKMSEYKQLLKKRLELSKKKQEEMPSGLGISRELEHRLLPQKKDKQTVRAQAASSPELVKFLSNIMVEDYFTHTFTKTYGEERAHADGIAQHAETVFNLLKGLENG